MRRPVQEQSVRQGHKLTSFGSWSLLPMLFISRSNKQSPSGWQKAHQVKTVNWREPQWRVQRGLQCFLTYNDSSTVEPPEREAIKLGFSLAGWSPFPCVSETSVTEQKRTTVLRFSWSHRVRLCLNGGAFWESFPFPQRSNWRQFLWVFQNRTRTQSNPEKNTQQCKQPLQVGYQVLHFEAYARSSFGKGVFMSGMAVTFPSFSPHRAYCKTPGCTRQRMLAVSFVCMHYNLKHLRFTHCSFS